MTSGNALARFEFERLDSKDRRDNGTKVLMVEWVEDSSTAPIAGEWSIGWDGKSEAAVVATEAQILGEQSRKEGQLHRLYFLLPHWARVPGTVVLTLTGSRVGKSQEKIVWRTHPLPAIYPAALGNSARASGKRGVLHTIWAKKRLQSLASEIETEELQNPESISLDLAIQERDWIEKNFGVQTKPRKIDLGNTSLTPTHAGGALGSPTSPKSPGRGPLLEKLKGLKLATGADDLKTKDQPVSTSQEGATTTIVKNSEHNPLSPETSDVAVSWTSFANLQGMGPTMAKDSLAAKPPQQSSQPADLCSSSSAAPITLSSPPQPAMRTIAPPESVLEQQRLGITTDNSSLGMRSAGGMSSLDAFASTSTSAAPSSSPPSAATSSSEVQFRQRQANAETTNAQSFSPTSVDTGNNDEDDLFALPMSPRSPAAGGAAAAAEQARKFTFEVEDTGRYAAGGGGS